MGEAIGFIGLGRMGLPLAHRLLEAGHSLRVWNRTARKADFLVELGAEDVTHPRDVVDPGGIVFTMVTDDHALTEVVTGPNGFAERLGPRGVHVSMSTVSPATARHLAELRCRQQSEYVAAPVFGRPDAVAMGKLWMCLSGSRGAKDRVGVLIRQLGQGMFDFGDDPGAAHVVKLAGNFVLAAAIESLAEAVIFAGRNGIGRQQLADLLGQTLFACPAYQIYGKAIAEERYTPAGFTTALGLKDMNLVLQVAAASQMPVPLASLVRDRLQRLVASGRAELDWAAMAQDAAEDAGLRPRPA